MRLAYPVATPEVAGRLLAWSAPLASCLPALARQGYTGVELFVRNPGEFDSGQVARLLREHHLKVAAIGTGPVAVHDRLTFADADPAIRAAAVARAKTIIDFAAELQTQVNVGKLRGTVRHHPAAAQWRDDGFRAICDHAAQRHVLVTLEPQHRGIIDNLNTTAESLAWLEHLAHPALRLMLDSHHMQLEDPSLPAALSAARGPLIHVHLADTGRLVPGRGEIDFPLFLRTLRGIGYDGFLTVEIEQTPDSASAAALAARYLSLLLDRI
jgi:sugar phosphate isomerase/epimerase